jgi:MFS family permease
MRYIIVTRALFVITSAMCLEQLPIQLKNSGLRIGEVVATYTALQCIFLVFGAWISTKLAKYVGGMRNVALGTLATFIGSQVLYWIAATFSSLPVFLLAQVIHSLVVSLFYPFSNTLMELSFNKNASRKQRGFLQTIGQASEAIGAVIGILLITSQLGLLTWGVGVVGAVLTFLLFAIDPFPELPAAHETETWRSKFIQIDVFKAIYHISFVGIVRGILLFFVAI